MAKSSSVYICQACGYASAGYLGKCPDCGTWNSFLETVRESEVRQKQSASGKLTEARLLSEIDTTPIARLDNAGEELDRVLGGGFVPGSTVLLAGDPGIGKSTLALQAVHGLSQRQNTVIYITSEETVAQIRERAGRLNLSLGKILATSTTDLDDILNLVVHHKPSLVVVDSIQTIAAMYMEQPPGSVSQVKECTLRLSRAARESGCAIVLIGHVTKEGMVAGPRAMEHMVDAVLYLEGDRYHRMRVLRSVKNRYGSTNEVGMLSMTEGGLTTVSNPSELFLTERRLHVPGSAVAAVLEGTRSFLIEIQALTCASTLTYPRRNANGLDPGRLALILAVLERHVGIITSNSDVYLNVVGGFAIEEPAADLAVCLAIASSLRGKAIYPDMVAIGEVGLGGELRGVSGIRERVREAERIGFGRVLLPFRDADSIKSGAIQRIGAGNLAEALEAAWE